MGKNVLTGLAIVALLLFSSLTTFKLQYAKALPPPVVPLNPPAQIYVNQSVVIAPVGQTVNFSIYVSSPIALNLTAWQLELRWDPNILKYESSSRLFFGPFYYTFNKVNATMGRLFSGVCEWNDSMNVPSASPIEVFEVTFLSNGYGTTSLNITNFGLIAQSNIGNEWTNATIPLLTQYERWPDVDGDIKISLADMVLVDLNMGLKAGDSNFYSDCDFNNDSIVDAVDMEILMQHYRWIGSPPPGPSYTMYLFNETIQNATVYATIPGDINGDFNVTLLDLVLLANAYGTTPASGGGPGAPHAWNPNADINGDLRVDIRDLVILANHYGQHYP